MVKSLMSAGVDGLLEPADPELDAVDHLVVEYARAAWEAPKRIRDGLSSRLRPQFSEAQLVELTLRITFYGFFNRFNDALQIEKEEEVRPHRTALTG